VLKVFQGLLSYAGFLAALDELSHGGPRCILLVSTAYVTSGVHHAGLYSQELQTAFDSCKFQHAGAMTMAEYIAFCNMGRQKGADDSGVV
jgi:hypothetical protein